MHLPGTVLNDEFGSLGIPEALERLAACDPVIQAVGVTDYATTSTFRRALAAWNAGAGAAIELLFPNVELRLQVPTVKGRAVNLHLLCAPTDVDELDRFLGLIDFQYQSRKYRATRDDLIALGRQFKQDPGLDDAAALREGTMQFKVDFDRLRSIYKEEAWARENCLIGFAGGQGDGTSGVRGDGGAFEAHRQEIERFAHTIFSGNPQTRLFWLGEGADSVVDLERKFGGPKLCLHGSDAHSLAKLGAPDGDRYCWLRGDATFETLLQSCIEPGGRSFVGSVPPGASQAQGRIEELVVTSPGWFPPSVQINPGLVAIIGARGSGKTALADLIAAAAGSHQPAENPDSFIRRADPLIRGTIAAANWTDESITTQPLGEQIAPDPLNPTPVRYLSQQFVDQLCAVDGVSDRLRHEIERVVFNAWPIENRLGATNFDELLAMRLQAARAREETQLDAIRDISSEITTQRLLRESLQSLRDTKETQEADLAKLLREVEALTVRGGPERAERLLLVSRALANREQLLQGVSRKLNALRSLESDIADFRASRFPRQLASLKDQHAEAGLSADQWKEFEIAFGGEVDRVLSNEVKKAEGLRSAIAGEESDSLTAIERDELSAEALEALTVAELRAERKRLEKLVGLDETRTKRLALVNDKSGQARSEISKTSRAVEDATNAQARIEELTAERLNRYAAYFDALLEEESDLNALYAPLQRILLAGGASVAKLDFAVARVVDLDAWAAHGEELLDLRKEGPFRLRGTLAQIADQELGESWRAGDGRAAADAIDAFSRNYSEALRDQASADRQDKAAYRSWVSSVAAWLYRADHVSLRYSLSYEGLDIARLSPGTRGIVLLLLYLAVDEEETVPLIIDQPEENLDPESVHAELVDLFRATSQRRQVIMVTHNANLVVNTDVDQVIVAHCGALEVGKLPNLTYLAGGLENPEIRAAVCQVLEGGEEALRARARRLRVALNP